MKNWKEVTIVGVLCFAVGFFSGREYLRYQIEKSIGDFFNGMNADLGELEAMLGEQSGAGMGGRDILSDPNFEPSPYIEAKLTNKEFYKANLSAGEYQDEIRLAVMFRNRHWKNVSQIDGTLSVVDQYGREQFELDLDYAQMIPSESEGEWTARINYDPALQCCKWLKEVDKDEVMLMVQTEKLWFSDGTSG